MSRARAQSLIDDAKDAGKDEPESLQRCLVYCRLRPTKPGELNEKEGIFKLVDLHKKTIKVGDEKTYTFDGTFNPGCTQEEIFQEVARPSVEHVLKGYTAAIMAYGQTGTGKSFTMSNSKPGQEGIIPRSAGYLFDIIANDTKKAFKLSANFVQIYRDNLSDLMIEEGQKGPKVDIRWDQKKGVEITNCTLVEIPSKESFMAMYQEGDSRRVVRATKMNPESSRGHTALVLYVESTPTDPNDVSKPTLGKITFIDLAGYERFDKTGVRATPGNEHIVDEAKKINASLLSLGHVVSALSNGEKHIPWRDSKLTRLLQDSIGGKSRSTIMITIGPASSHLHETTNSLSFGNRAMAVKVSAKLEQDIDYQKLAAKLQAMLDEKEERLDKLELAEKTREVERQEREARHKRDLARLRQRHKDELTQLMAEGATAERIEKLLQQHDVEDLNLQEEQEEEREFEEERHTEEERKIVKEIESQHRVRAASMKKEGFEAKQRELDAAYALIAQLRGTDNTADIASEISQLAGTPAPNGEATPEDLASPKSINSAEVAILRREIEDLKKKAEADAQKMQQTKAAHLKCAALLKEAREQNKKLAKEAVDVEQMQRLEGEVEELKNAKAQSNELVSELETRLETQTKKLHTLEKQLEVAEAEKAELSEEFNRKQRERESASEEMAAESVRKVADLESQIAALKEQVAQMETNLQKAKEEQNEVEARLAEKEKQLAEKEDEVAAKQKDLEDMQKQFAEAEEAARATEETQRKRERELEKAVEQCRDETRTVSKEKQQEIEETQATTSLKLSELRSKLESLSADAESSRADGEKERDELQAAVTASEKALEEERAAHQTVKEKLADVEQQLESASARAESGEGAERELRASLDSLKAEHEAAASQANEALAQAEAKLASVSEQLAASEEKSKALEAECESLGDQLDAARKTCGELETRLEDVTTDLSMAQEELQDEKEAREEDRVLMETEFQDSKRRMEEEAEAMKNEKDHLEEELNSGQQYSEALEKRVDELEAKLRELQGDYDQEKTKAQLEAEELKKKTQEERKLREEEQRKLIDLKERSAEEQESIKAQMQQRLEEEMKKKASGKYKYKSKLVSQLAGIGQFAPPRDAPPVLRPADLLASLDIEEVKQALRYKIVCIGAQHTGKSSVVKCLTHEGSVGIIKKAPDVVNPTTTVSVTEYTVRDKAGGGFLSKKHSLNTYFEVWDTPCDPRTLAALPPGALPVTGCAYAVTFFLNHEFGAEAAKMEEVLQAVYSSAKLTHQHLRQRYTTDQPRKGPRFKIPVVLFGTRKDLVPGGSSGAVKKIAEAKRWFREFPLAQQHFQLLECYAVSCKDWNALTDTPGKSGTSSFSSIMSHLGSELSKEYPNTPPALLKPHDISYGAGSTMELGEWYQASQEVHSEKERHEKAKHKAVLSLLVHVHRMRQRGVWLLGSQEFEAAVLDHVPSHVYEQEPDIVQDLKEVLVTRGIALPPIHDAATHPDDPRESVVVIGVKIILDCVSTLFLPSLYLSLLDSYASEKPGYLKGVVQKATGFNVEEVWRPDWELVFDGKLSKTAADSWLFKNSKAFRRDPALGFEFLEPLGVGFNITGAASANDSQRFCPGVALRRVSPELESMLLAVFKKHCGAWSAATSDLPAPFSPRQLALLQKRLHHGDPNVLLWGNGAAAPHGGKWGYIKVKGGMLTVCAEGKNEGVLGFLKGVVEEVVRETEGGAKVGWRDGMSLEHLPALPPSISEKVDGSTGTGLFLTSLPQDSLRGIMYPAISLENDLKKWGRTGGKKSDAPPARKLDSARLTMFEDK